MAASGALELVAGMMPFLHGSIPGTVHFTDSDPECPLNVMGPDCQQSDVEHVLSNSFGFGGQNAAVILGAP
jgi:3-oxoacyl-[acyl-carrier-protein] synthase II